MNQTQMDIAKTKAVLIDRGWTQWEYQSASGLVCLSEAIIIAVNDGRSEHLRGFRSEFLAATTHYFDGDKRARAQRAQNVVKAIVGREYGTGYGPVSALFILNDFSISSHGEALTLLDKAMTTARTDQ